ncbi:MAG: hypothetical protein IT223_06890 [Crocinitomicaceae bacterium]|nr:hypothetical protein [Crocinitomicaceae bacterium]
MIWNLSVLEKGSSSSKCSPVMGKWLMTYTNHIRNFTLGGSSLFISQEYYQGMKSFANHALARLQ